MISITFSVSPMVPPMASIVVITASIFRRWLLSRPCNEHQFHALHANLCSLASFNGSSVGAGLLQSSQGGESPHTSRQALQLSNRPLFRFHQHQPVSFPEALPVFSQSKHRLFSSPRLTFLKICQRRYAYCLRRIFPNMARQ